MPWRSGSGLSAHLEPGEAGSVMKALEKLDFQGFWARRKSRILGPPAIFQKPAQIQPAGRRSRHIGQLRPNGLANLSARIDASTPAAILSPGIAGRRKIHHKGSGKIEFSRILAPSKIQGRARPGQAPRQFRNIMWPHRLVLEIYHILL